MCDVNLLTLNNQKLYLAHFELVSGQYGQPFVNLFYANNEKDLKKKVHKYLRSYYGRGNNTEVEKNVYYYLDREVAVKRNGWEEITNYEQLVNHLLTDEPKKWDE